jgi:hypothetical protein
MLDLIDRFGGRVPLVVNAHPSLSGAQNEIGNSQILDVGKTGKSTYATAGVLHVVTLSSALLGSALASRHHQGTGAPLCLGERSRAEYGTAQMVLA